MKRLVPLIWLLRDLAVGESREHWKGNPPWSLH